MSRRRRQRPATPAEQAAMVRAAELARAAFDAPAGQCQAAADRLRRQVDQIRDPSNLASVPAAELPAAALRLFPGLDDDPDDLEQVRNP